MEGVEVCAANGRTVFVRRRNSGKARAVIFGQVSKALVFAVKQLLRIVGYAVRWWVLIFLRFGHKETSYAEKRGESSVSDR